MCPLSITSTNNSSQFVQRRKNYADRLHVLSGVEGEVHGGITICEKNRISEFVTAPSDIDQLRSDCNEKYKKENINAIVFGLDYTDPVRYAIYVEDGFLADEE